MPDCCSPSALILHLAVLAVFTEINPHLFLQLSAFVALWLQLALASPREAGGRAGDRGQQPQLGRDGHAPHPAWGRQGLGSRMGDTASPVPGHSPAAGPALCPTRPQGHQHRWDGTQGESGVGAVGTALGTSQGSDNRAGTAAVRQRARARSTHNSSAPHTLLLCPLFKRATDAPRLVSLGVRYRLEDAFLPCNSTHSYLGNELYKY